ncbi:MAG: hypothetical protein AT718_04495 [Vulcanisaeta sp. JCHS_4]|jgi:hypothetical protein|nr:MAG: hypothetical protein AT718_04495 [Vulcanisaeta sp. JCHS_4]
MSGGPKAGFTLGGLVVLGLVIITVALITYLVSNYLYVTYEAGRYSLELSNRLSSLSRSCIAYIANNSLYFPYSTYVEYSIPNTVKPGLYSTLNLTGFRGEVLIFTEGCTILVKSTGNATGFEVIGYGTG